MFKFFKHRVVRLLEKIPFVQIYIYNNLKFFKFLFPHDKDYYALRLIFKLEEKRTFLDVGGNIGLSSIGFRELGFKENKIFIFEPDKYLCDTYLVSLNRYYKNIFIFNYGLSYKNDKKYLYQAYYKNLFLHFNNSFDLSYIKKKIKDNYPDKYKNFLYRKKRFLVKKFDQLNIKKDICFIKIDVEGFDHLVLRGMKKLIIQNHPVFLIEFNASNFTTIYNLLKKKYDCFIYLFEKNELKKLNKIDIKNLFSNKTLDIKYSKNSFNIFFVPINFNFHDKNRII